METISVGSTEISIKLTTSGKYVWTITSTFPTTQSKEAIETLKVIEGQLKEKFPNYPIPGSGRVTNLEEE